ncbi:uncharacterized protein LOC125886949 isoform X4 [Epinephelus fuscoguttatus]|uniref:uncharacterized protein LOC125886949 isoform X4 n=1 Tax=Epinephelus fuscoguttatus TaxID=293821 RepID=UPI0020D11BEA|nr:uncharacterized protein LOC125886949 isoform X4 [Epinephelus fuscoguttatus]
MNRSPPPAAAAASSVNHPSFICADCESHWPRTRHRPLLLPPSHPSPLRFICADCESHWPRCLQMKPSFSLTCRPLDLASSVTSPSCLLSVERGNLRNSSSPGAPSIREPQS